jgi:hypothetical protein
VRNIPCSGLQTASGGLCAAAGARTVRRLPGAEAGEGPPLLKVSVLLILVETSLSDRQAGPAHGRVYIREYISYARA